MKNLKFNHFILVCFAWAFFLFAFSCKSEFPENTLIVSLSPVNSLSPDFKTGEGWRYVAGSQIISVNPGKSSNRKVLTKDFFSACSPDVSWDGQHMLFAAQKNENDPWQIWEMDLKKKTFRKVTNTGHNAMDPVYLPLDQFVYSEELNDSLGTRHMLFCSRLDGTDIRQITFAPQNYFATVVLRDGRLVAISNQVLPEHKDPLYTVLRHDGTKADPFYRAKSGSVLLNRLRESENDQIFFVEAEMPGLQGEIVSVSYNRPFGSKELYTTGITGSFKAVFPGLSDKLWVSYSENTQNQPFALYSFDKKQKKLGKRIFADDQMHVTDVVEVFKHNRPKKLPSEVDMGVKTGLLVCLDLNFSEQQILHPSADFKLADRLEVLGADTSYGVVEAETDGSVYLKILADKPFRIQTLDKNGKVVLAPGNWMWLRPNERRGFVSFYDNSEVAPENIVPLAIKKAPVIIPIVISEVQEKEVELE